jgi:hypothetical protein
MSYPTGKRNLKNHLLKDLRSIPDVGIADFNFKSYEEVTFFLPHFLSFIQHFHFPLLYIFSLFLSLSLNFITPLHSWYICKQDKYQQSEQTALHHRPLSFLLTENLDRFRRHFAIPS